MCRGGKAYILKIVSLRYGKILGTDNKEFSDPGRRPPEGEVHP
jgi:hypothetical protein